MKFIQRFLLLALLLCLSSSLNAFELPKIYNIKNNNLNIYYIDNNTQTQIADIAILFPKVQYNSCELSLLSFMLGKKIRNYSEQQTSNLLNDIGIEVELNDHEDFIKISARSLAADANQ